jgi:hypothetical protein
MVKCRVGDDDSYGAGIIFGAQSGRLYIATANHVVRSTENDAKDIKVEIKSRPGEWFPAKLLDNADGGLDLAVLSLEDPISSVGQTSIQVLGEPESLSRGDFAYHVGFPRMRPWYVNTTPDTISRISTESIFFESNTVDKGDSGGTLLNNAGELVGMIKEYQPPEGVAVRIDRVAAKLKEWGYPVRLYKFTRPVSVLVARSLPQGWRELSAEDVVARMNNASSTLGAHFPPDARVAVVQSLHNNANSVIIATQPMTTELGAMSADAIRNQLDSIFLLARGMFEQQGFKVRSVSKAATLSGENLVGARMTAEKTKGHKKLINVWVVCRNPSDSSTMLYLYGEADENDRDELVKVIDGLLGKQ